MMVPVDGRIDERWWEFLGKQSLGMDRVGGRSAISGRLVAMRNKLVMKVGVENGRVHDFVYNVGWRESEE